MSKTLFWGGVLCALFVSSSCLYSQAPSSNSVDFHFQQTIVSQYHPGFSAQYSGDNSLLTHESAQNSLTSTFYFHTHPWKGAELNVSEELSGGSGLSHATGVAGFPNGETFRVGGAEPAINLARLYIKQELGNEWIIHVGKISISDYFDNNQYSHDPRTQFLNWSLMSNGAWDYPADTRGYTWGIVSEWNMSSWVFRAATTMVPTEANGSTFDPKLSQANSETIEIEKGYTAGDQKGIIRALAFCTTAHMGNYAQATTLSPPDIEATRAYGRTKYGFGLNIEHTLTPDFGMMFRASWNDGKNETWMFTEIDQSISLAGVWDGHLWKKNGDKFGIGTVLNGLSGEHQAYLARGGYGFIIGDGELRYSPEWITEAYYSFAIPEYHLWITPDYQFVVNPAYNADRGPAHIFAIRAHVEF